MKMCKTPTLSILLLFTILLTCSPYCFANDIISTRFGYISVNNILVEDETNNSPAIYKSIVKFKDDIIYQTEPGMAISVYFLKLYNIQDSDVILISESQGGTIGTDDYWFITINHNGVKSSKSFTTFANFSAINVKQKGHQIVVNYKYIKEIGMTLPPVIYKNGDIKVKLKKCREKCGARLNIDKRRA